MEKPAKYFTIFLICAFAFTAYNEITLPIMNPYLPMQPSTHPKPLIDAGMTPPATLLNVPWELGAVLLMCAATVYGIISVELLEAELHPEKESAWFFRWMLKVLAQMVKKK